MFNNKTEDETDFCESYKSQILNSGTEEKSSSFGTVLKILTILLLLAVILALSMYGYNYFMNKSSTQVNVSTPPTSIQISDEDLKVIDESSDETPEKTPEAQKPLKEEGSLPPVIEENNSSQKSVSISTINESDIDKIANDVKVAIAQEEEKDKNKSLVEKKSVTPETEENISEEESLKVPVPNSPEAKYLEDLADLSKEIDKERKKK